MVERPPTMRGLHQGEERCLLRSRYSGRPQSSWLSSWGRVSVPLNLTPDGHPATQSQCCDLQ